MIRPQRIRKMMEGISRCWDMKKKRNIDLTKDEAMQVILKHLTEQMRQDIMIQDGIPEGCFIYGMPKDEPCWTAWIPGPKNQLDGGEYVCVSKKTGKIFCDGFTNWA